MSKKCPAIYETEKTKSQKSKGLLSWYCKRVFTESLSMKITFYISLKVKNTTKAKNLLKMDWNSDDLGHLYL